MFLYNVNLSPPTSINCAVVGNFSGQKTQEFIFSRGGSVIELYRPDPETDSLVHILSWDVFGIIRCLIPFRLVGASKDYVAVGSDSGKIVILEYMPDKNLFKKVHEETFGKSGCRRIVPGEYIAADPKGRALMIAAIEKQKFVYVTNRDSAANLTISSPLEAHKGHTIIYDCCGVDVGFENPLFGCIEIDYSEADQDPSGDALESTQKMLVYYELDLGLNHVTRKSTEPVDPRANKLIPVPGGNDGPSGLLVCAENNITYKRIGAKDIKIPIPRRKGPFEDNGRGVIVVSYTVYKTKSLFFFFLQTEDGDIFKVTFDCKGDVVNDIKIKYYDTVPTGNSLCILRSGFLFVASEFGNHQFYRIQSLGDESEEFSAVKVENEKIENLYFEPTPLKNLVLTDELENHCPITDCKVGDFFGEESPRFYLTCGRGPRSSLKILKNGLEVNEIAASSLPGNPNAVWTVKKNMSEKYDTYIVVSFVNATLVLSIGENVEEVRDSGFLATTPTLSVSQLGEDSLLQVYPEGIRHIRADRRVTEWRAPYGKHITKAATNQRQVAVALTGGEVVYFELDSSGHLNEYQERKQLNSEVSAIAIGPIPDGRLRSKFLVVSGTGSDTTVRLFSLDPDDCFQPLSVQALPSQVESLCMIEIPEDEGVNTIFLNIGLQNGVFIRAVVDNVSGTLSDTRTRFLGARPVRFFKVKIQGKPAVLALSTRAWLSYYYRSRHKLTPLSLSYSEYASSFSSEQSPEAFVTISGSSMRILSVEKIGYSFNQTVTPLKYTPRKFVIHPQNKNLIVIETEHQMYSPFEKAKILQQKSDDDMEVEDADSKTVPDIKLPFEPKAESGKWASRITLLEPSRGTELSSVELQGNEAAVCLTTCLFQEVPGEVFLIVATAKDMTLAPKTCSSGFLYTFRFVKGGHGLELYHKTQIEDIPTALCPFQGRLLVGMGTVMRIYDLGKKKLLRKCENKTFPNSIVNIQTQGDRIIVGDIQESFHFAKYKYQDNQIITFADETTPRWITSACLLDYDTIAGGDKFGNFFVSRLPKDTSDEIEDDTTGNKLSFEKGVLNGAPYKLGNIAQYHVGDIITSINRTTLHPGSNEILVYTTLSGAIGAFIAFTSRDDVDFFQHLEVHMKTELPPLCGRDHLAFRSYYGPVKNVIDGTLCEQYGSLPYKKRSDIAQELDRTVNEVSKKIEDIRNRVAY